MDFFNDRDLTEDEKEDLSKWMKEKLTEAMGECDDVFLQYMMVMVQNGKTMQEISTDLEAFVGEPACSEFALR